MPLYTYTAQKPSGEINSDSIQANSREDAAATLKADGLKVLTVKDMDSGVNITIGGKITVSELAAFSRFMATMLRSGLSLPEAVDIIKQETQNKKFEKILADISFQVRKGRSISSVLSQHGEVFSQIFLAIIKAGEESGSLDKAFDYLATQLTASYELSQKVKGSLMYPAVILTAMLGVGILMFVFVLPKIAEVFTKMNIELPVYTKAVLSAGTFIGNHPTAVLLSVFLVGVGIFLVFKFDKSKQAAVRLFTKIPAARKVAVNLDVARFSRTLSTLLKSGVAIVDALDVSASALTQPKLQAAAKAFSKGVSEGESLSEIMNKGKNAFPSTMAQTIKAGEKTGTLDQVLNEMAEFYEHEVDYNLKKFVSLLEPVLMLFIGVAVGVMVIIIIAPIYSIVGGLQSTVGE